MNNKNISRNITHIMRLGEIFYPLESTPAEQFQEDKINCVIRNIKIDGNLFISQDEYDGICSIILHSEEDQIISLSIFFHNSFGINTIFDIVKFNLKRGSNRVDFIGILKPIIYPHPDSRRLKISLWKNIVDGNCTTRIPIKILSSITFFKYKALHDSLKLYNINHYVNYNLYHGIIIKRIDRNKYNYYSTYYNYKTKINNRVKILTKHFNKFLEFLYRPGGLISNNLYNDLVK